MTTPSLPQVTQLRKRPLPTGAFFVLGCCAGFLAGQADQRAGAAGGTVSTSLPLNTTGPVGRLVGEPPSGSTVTA